MKFKDILDYIIIILVVIVIRTYIFTPIRVTGESMQDTLLNGDLMILTKYNKNYQRFDIIVVDNGKDKIIKRIIGLPGEDVEYKDNVLYINGEVIEDKFASNPTSDFIDYCGEDEYFVLGDNRGNSLDSRKYGCFNKRQILGKTSFTFFPFKRIGIKD